MNDKASRVDTKSRQALMSDFAIARVRKELKNEPEVLHGHVPILAKVARRASHLGHRRVSMQILEQLHVQVG